jgi:hypothetical protein
MLSAGQRYLCTIPECLEGLLPRLNFTGPNLHLRFPSLFVGQVPRFDENLAIALFQRLCNVNSCTTAVGSKRGGMWVHFERDEDRLLVLETCKDRILVVGENIYFSECTAVDFQGLRCQLDRRNIRCLVIGVEPLKGGQPFIAPVTTNHTTMLAQKRVAPAAVPPGKSLSVMSADLIAWKKMQVEQRASGMQVIHHNT